MTAVNNGQSSEQWRAEGHCEELPVREIMDVVPMYSLSNMMAAEKLRRELHSHSMDESSTAVEKMTAPTGVEQHEEHLAELVEQARVQIDTDPLTTEAEIDEMVTVSFVRA